LRRTFASLLLASGADVPYAMAQLGHENAQMTLNVYAKVIASKTDHGAAVDALVGVVEWAPMGTTAIRLSWAHERHATLERSSAALTAGSGAIAPDGFEPSTSRL